jgi:hypothetical protein
MTISREKPPLRAREEIARAAEAFRIAVIESGALNHVRQDTYFTQLRAIETALALSRTAGQEWREPEGWQLVPKELTEDMAAEIECSDGTDEGWQRALASCPPLPAPPVAAGKSQ